MESVTQTGTILVVDDDPDFRQEMKYYLERDGFTVVEAASQREASDRIRDMKPDLAVINLVMEQLDSGFVLSYHIKKAYPTVPVILVTASTGDTHLDFDTATESERSWIKADVLLQKPLRYEQIKREILRLI